RFSVQQKVPLVVELSGRGEQNPCSVEASINTHPLDSFGLERGETRHRFEIPAAYLQEGENRLFLSSAQKCLWKSVQVRPAAAAGTPLSSSVLAGAPASLRLPALTALHFSPELRGRERRLRIDEVRAWSAPGTAPEP